MEHKRIKDDKRETEEPSEEEQKKRSEKEGIQTAQRVW